MHGARSYYWCNQPEGHKGACLITTYHWGTGPAFKDRNERIYVVTETAFSFDAPGAEHLHGVFREFDEARRFVEQQWRDTAPPTRAGEALPKPEYEWKGEGANYWTYGDYCIQRTSFGEIG